MTTVIEVNIAPEIFDRIREAVESCQKSGVSLEGAPIDILVPLPGNRVVLISPEGEQRIPIEELPKLQVQSLIPASFFIGEGSQISGCAVGDTSKFRPYG